MPCISVSHSGQPTISLKSIFDQQLTHFLSRAALCIEAVGFSMARCAALAAASVITCSGLG
jgi:hypothetical protein